MHFRTSRTALLRVLTAVSGAAQRSATMPILQNVLVELKGQAVRLTATDTEVEIRSIGEVSEGREDGNITVPAKKLMDIVRALPDANDLTFKVDKEKVVITSGRGRYTFATLPATEFPTTPKIGDVVKIEASGKELRRLMNRVSIAMASGDVRAYLNGMLLEVRGNRLRCVASDGHRMAIAEMTLAKPAATEYTGIVPRKGVAEIIGVLPEDDTVVTVEAATNHVRVVVNGTTVCSRLIAGTFPNYEAVVPAVYPGDLVVETSVLREAVRRAALLANSKFHGIRLSLKGDTVRLLASHESQGDAYEEVVVKTDLADIEFGVNYQYLQAALEAIDGDDARIQLRDATTSLLLTGAGDNSVRHIVMPLRI